MGVPILESTDIKAGDSETLDAKAMAFAGECLRKVQQGGAEAVADAVDASAVVLATPAELCSVLEHRPSLYGALRCEALVCDELDLLMPSRKSSGAKVTRWQDRGDHPAEALAKLAAKRCGSSLQVLAGSATLDRASKTKLERALKGAPKVALPLPVVACDAGKNLVVKTKRAPGRPGNVRTTIAPKRVVHRLSLIHI